jgi:bacteriocin-like protein
VCPPQNLFSEFSHLPSLALHRSLGSVLSWDHAKKAIAPEGGESLLASARFPRRATEEKTMRNLSTNELAAVSGGAARKQDIPAKAPGESYKGPADKNFGPK